MINERSPYVESFQREATSVATFTGKLPRVDSCDYVLVRSLTVSNADTAAKVAHVGIMYNSLALYVQTLALTTAGYFYKMSGTLVVPKGYQIIVKFDTPDDGDKYYVNASGEYVSYAK